jgi:hypothetical protein
VIVSRKAAFSLLISILLFAVFTALAFTGLFDLVEARFYNPAVVRAIGREIDADTQVVEEFFEELQIRFAATLDEGAVRRSLLSDLESEDIALRASLYGELLESLGGLQSVRFIDSGGRRIHFSTWPPDILRQDRNSIAYRNYGAAENSAAYIPYGQVETTVPKLILDGAGERIIFSHPFYDSFDVYRGTALFSLSVRAVMDRMVNAGRIKVGEDISVVSEPPGLVAGLPPMGRNVLLPLIARVWSENSLSLGRLNSNLTGVNLALISRKADQNIYIGRLVNESLLSLPLAMRIILLISFLITVYLIIFLLFNLRQDDITIIQSRLKKLQVNLLEEYYEHTEGLNWNRWKRELEHRREDIHAELKRGLSIKDGAGGLAEIDAFIDRSWDDLMAIIGRHIERRAGIDEDTLRALLGRLLPEISATASRRALDKAGPEEAERIEALDEADIVEALEGPAEKKADPEAPEPELEELEELDELEESELEEIEELEIAEQELADPEELDGSAGEEAIPEAPEPELAELEAAELELAGPEMPGDVAVAGTAEPELAELEAGEPELAGAEAAAGPEAPGDAAVAGTAEPELAELEAGEPELAGAEAAARAEMPGDVAVAGVAEPEAAKVGAAEPELAGAEAAARVEAPEPDELTELEAAEPDLVRLEAERQGAMARFYGFEPLTVEDSDESEIAIDTLVSAIEFSPEPKEVEREKEKAAKSMAENVEIQSPFASIFSALSELEFEPEPMEDLETLEKERLTPDDSPETEAEELRFSIAGPQLSIPFMEALNSEITVLTAEDEDEDAPAMPEEVADAAPEEAEAGRVIMERDGLIYIDESVLHPDKETLKGLDKNFKNLIDSILNNT